LPRIVAAMAVPLVLDTDIGTDVDDALALALALRHPVIDLRAVTTVSADTRARGQIAARLLVIAGHPEVEVAAGVVGFEERAWMGHEGRGLPPGDALPLSDRDAVALLLDESRSPSPPVVATVGMQSNVAAAVDRDATYPERVPRLAVMGGVFAPVRPFGAIELPPFDHNLIVDSAASVRSLNAGFDVLYVPFDVTVNTILTRGQLDRLRRGDELCQALAALVDVWSEVLHEMSGGALPDEIVAMLHDPLTVACLVERSFVTTETLPVTVAMHDGGARTFIDPIGGREAEVVRSVDAPAFADWWLETVLGG
jgi:purine nucleosidase